MKKRRVLFGTILVALGLFVGCSKQTDVEYTTTPLPDYNTVLPPSGTTQDRSDNPVNLAVVTSYGASDGYRSFYEDAYEAFEKATGHTVLDTSEMSSEAWKSKVRMDFQTGAEPDVLFFFAGQDADLLVSSDKVVSLEEIRAVYPRYGSNMREELLPTSPVDGKQYVIPVNGYWEGLYVNTVVLEEVGITLPTDDMYTWTQFLADCATIAEAGYIPIAAALGEEPHYLFEATVLNNGLLENHLDIPTAGASSTAWKWMAALDDIKELYQLGYFPEDTLTATSEEVSTLLLHHEAAFQFQGSWHIQWLKEQGNVDDFQVTYIPLKGFRDPNVMVGGISMGYYITRRGWEDPDRQQAAVDFVTAMTTRDVVSHFGVSSLTALSQKVTLPTTVSNVERSAVGMNENATGVVSAVQDGLDTESREALFRHIAEVATGTMGSEEAVMEALGLPW